VLLEQWQTGDSQAADKVLERVYSELKKIAGACLKTERVDHTLVPTALVSELYLKFSRSSPIRVQNRAQFFALAAQSIRQILVDYARRRKAAKRGGEALKITLSAAGARSEADNQDLLAVHEALTKLEDLDRHLARVTELRFFGGLSENEIAEVLGVSRNSVQRDWRAARAWLMASLRNS
jgi:RNA polymerase sigma factor (TIGR02999 family)